MAEAEEPTQDDSTEVHSEDYDHVSRLEVEETWYSYLVLFISFTSCFLMDGMQFSYGVTFQDFKSYFSADSSALTWPAAVQTFTMHFGALVTSAFVEVFGLRAAGFLGGLFAATGFVLASYARNLPLFTVAYGLIAGTGYAFLYLASSVSVQKFFSRNRAVATGFACAGSSLGVFAVSPLLRYLLDRYTWRGCMLIQAGIALQNTWLWMLVSPVRSGTRQDKRKTHQNIKLVEIQKTAATTESLLQNHQEQMKMKKYEAKDNLSQKLIATLKGSLDFKLFKQIYFSIYMVALFTTELAFPIMYIFAPDKGTDMGFSYDQTKWFGSCVGIGSLTGRITAGVVGNASFLQGRRLHIHRFSVTLAGIGLLLIPICRSLWSILLILTICGFGTGGHVMVLMVALVDLFGHDVITRSFGLCLVVVGIASLIASPLAGYVRVRLKTYDPVFYLAGSYFLISLLIMSFIPATGRHSSGSLLNRCTSAKATKDIKI